MPDTRLRLPGRSSLFWKLACLLVGFCLLMVWLSGWWGRHIETSKAYLSSEARTQLTRYAAEAEAVLRTQGKAGLDRWLMDLRHAEDGWAGVIGLDLQSLASTPFSEEESARLTALRELDWPMSSRSLSNPWLKVPFPQDPGAGSLVIELPDRFVPDHELIFWRVMTNGVIPCLFTLLLCVGLYRLLIVPLTQLRDQANAWRADRLSSRVAPQVTARQDELGELGRAFDDMAERLQTTVSLQQQLLRDLSHELRTPLSRLRVACDGEQDITALRSRLSREIDGMQRLVDDTLQLAWLDTERKRLPLDAIQVLALWEMLAEDACFESAWPAAQLHCELGPDCWVLGHLNTLAQALENILRNAIRHSPADGVISLGGRRDGDRWVLWVQDRGAGVANSELERIFAPFTRLDGSRPGNGGFGLGLSIARNALLQQDGLLWAENSVQGLRLVMRLRAA